jgi:CRISPR-associated protein Cas2
MPFVLVAYDISDDGRRASVCDRLKSKGFTMLQKSVYLARGGSALAKDVARALNGLLDPLRDSVAILVIPRDVLERAIILGVNRVRIDERGYTVI